MPRMVVLLFAAALVWAAPARAIEWRFEGVASHIDWLCGGCKSCRRGSDCRGSDCCNRCTGNGGEDSPYDEPLVTDRPDFTESSSTVGAGIVQIESGYTFIYNDDDGARTRAHSGPETLFRIGVAEFVELRIFWNYAWERIDEGGLAQSDDGAEDLSIGTKLALTEQCGWFPETAVILEVSFPSGAEVFSSRQAEMGVNFLYSWTLPGDFLIGGSSGFGTSTELVELAAPGLVLAEARDRHNIFSQSVALGIPLTDCLGMYIEYFGLFSSGLAQDFPQNFVNGGFTYLLNNNVQLDVRAGTGLNDSADDFFAGAGISLRL